MQVKKFEAPTMKEAIKMIKNQLGPEAIILSAKDINKGFGLAGQKSVEVTAAVSEMTLRKNNWQKEHLMNHTKLNIHKYLRVNKNNLLKRCLKKIKQSICRQLKLQLFLI